MTGTQDRCRTDGTYCKYHWSALHPLDGVQPRCSGVNADGIPRTPVPNPPATVTATATATTNTIATAPAAAIPTATATTVAAAGASAAAPTEDECHTAQPANCSRYPTS